MPFTRAQYDALNDGQKQVLQAVSDNQNGQGERVLSEPWPGDNHDEWITEVFDILQQCQGCVPSGYEENLDQNIVRKFKGIYRTAADLAARALGLRDWDLSTVVEPSYEDSTSVAVIDWRDDQPYCYLRTDRKAWLFMFENLADLADEVIRARDRILATYRACHHPQG